MIVDFGFAIKLKDINMNPKQLKYCVGTPGYIAPEMLRGEPYNTKADVFSAGVTLYSMMNYCSPFSGKTVEKVME